MVPKPLPRVQPGDDIEAAHHNALVDALIEQRLIVGDSGGLVGGSGPFGTSLAAPDSGEMWIKLTSNLATTNQYAWTEVYPAVGGGWTLAFRSGTTTVDPAYEVNGNTAITTPFFVDAYRTASGDLRFKAGTC